jgi:4-amino-4-deoxy-L-arabinose transferase-like glycosyltransferase
LTSAIRLAKQYRSGLVASGLFLLALGVRLLYVRQAIQRDPSLGDPQGLWDSLYYHTRAQQLALGETPAVALDYLSPAYIQALGLVYRGFGPDPFSAIGFQALLGALSCVMLYVIGRRVFSESAGVIGAVLLAGFGPQVYYGGLLLSDTLVLGLNVAFLLALTPPRWTFSPARCAAAGVLLGFAVGARPNAILLLPVALLAMGLQARATPWRRHALLGTALLLGLAVGLSPFVYRNYEAIGQPLVLGATGGINLWKGNGPEATGTHVFMPSESRAGVGPQLREDVSNEDVLAESRDLTGRTIEYVKEHPGRAAGLLVKKAVLFFHSVEIGIRDQFYLARSMVPVLWLAPFTYGLIAPLGLAGMWLARRRGETVLLFGAFAVQFASLVLIFVLGRYRLVAAAILALFAGFALTTWARIGSERQWSRLLPSLGLAVLVAALTHIPLAEFPSHRGTSRRHMDIAEAYARKGRYDEAIQSFAAAAAAATREDSPVAGIAAARLGQAWMHITLGQMEAARLLLRPFMRPDEPHWLRERARILWELSFEEREAAD